MQLNSLPGPKLNMIGLISPSLNYIVNSRLTWVLLILPLFYSSQMNQVVLGTIRSLLQRHLCAGGYVTHNMDTHLYHATFDSSQSPAPGSSVTVHAPEKLSDSCWAKSLLHFASQGGMFFCRQGNSHLSCPSSTIINTPRPKTPLPLFDWVTDHHIYHLVGDFYCVPPDSPPS